jgi:hypothetical protein
MAVETGSESLALPEKKRFEKQVSSQKPFGLRTFFRGTATKSSEQDVLVLQSGGRAWISKAQVTAGVDLIDKWKVFTSKSSSEHAGQVDKNGQRRVLSLSGVIPPGSVVTETYILLGAYDTEQEARNCFTYVSGFSLPCGHLRRTLRDRHIHSYRSKISRDLGRMRICT